MTVRIVVATDANALDMAPRMREQDRVEVMTMGLTAEAALVTSLAWSLRAEAAMEGDRTLAMWGLCIESVMQGKAYLWALMSEESRPLKHKTARLSRQFVEAAQAEFPVLECMVDTRYATGIRWIEWLGFRLVGRAQYAEAPFNIYHRKA